MEQTETAFSLEQYPFPAVRLGEDFSLLERNRPARKLLPPPWRLRRLLEKMKERKEDRRWFLTDVDGICYLVGLLPQEKNYVAVFLENLIPMQEPLIRELFGEGLAILNECIQVHAEEPPTETENKKEFLERLISRTFGLREQMGMCHWLLSVSKRKWNEPCLCSLGDILSRFAEKLKKFRVQISLSCTTEDLAWISPDVLAALFLNLIQFSVVYEGIYTPCISVKNMKKRMQLCFSFSDEEEIFRDLAGLLNEKGEIKFGKGAMGLAPLFSVIVLCREHGIGMELSCSGKTGNVILTVPSASGVPAVFLESRAKPDENWMDAWIEEILFLNKKM